MLLFLSVIALQLIHIDSHRIKRDYLDLNSCFVYRKGYRLELKATDIESTDSIEFKDDCLRSCLTSMIWNGAPCRSLMHMPKDNDCVLTSVDGSKAVRRENSPNQIPVNFYENRCAVLPIQGGGLLEVGLRGFRGGEGAVRITAKRGENTQIFVVIDGIKADQKFDLLYLNDDVKDCLSLTHDERDRAKKWLTLRSDHTGLVVQPWKEIDENILDDSVVTKKLLVTDSQTGEPLLCGAIKMKSTAEEWKAAKDSSSSLSISIYLLLILIIFVP
ncbi:hypothetical protein AB6A40_008154 [Gnathostoma spinigerum]|uniref:Apple domain-containing protein n=1 Tax=Gnathostoma spinigerum TaxID=75299 RepID=A0ABD6EPI0_9BILA